MPSCLALLITYPSAYLATYLVGCLGVSLAAYLATYPATPLVAHFHTNLAAYLVAH